jgi:hypothetical protein
MDGNILKCVITNLAGGMDWMGPALVMDVVGCECSNKHLGFLKLERFLTN